MPTRPRRHRTIARIDPIGAGDDDPAFRITVHIPNHRHPVRKRKGREILHAFVPVNAPLNSRTSRGSGLTPRDLPLRPAKQKPVHRKLVSIPFQIFDRPQLHRNSTKIVPITSKSIGPGVKEWHPSGLGRFHERFERHRKHQAFLPRDFQRDEIHPRRWDHQDADFLVLKSPSIGKAVTGRASIESHR